MSPSTVANFVGSILAVDAAVSRAIHTAAKPFLSPFLLLLLEISADFRFSFSVSLSLLLSPPLRSFLIPFLLGLLFDLIFVGIVKLTFRRARPAYNHPSMSVAVSADHYSFPSGHASRVFFVAASVHFFTAAVEAEAPSYSFLDGWIRDHHDGDVKGQVVVVVWIWATVTAVSRILLGRHYVLDVASGACLGILEALFALRFLRFEYIFGRVFWLSSENKKPFAYLKLPDSIRWLCFCRMYLCKLKLGSSRLLDSLLLQAALWVDHLIFFVKAAVSTAFPARNSVD